MINRVILFLAIVFSWGSANAAVVDTVYVDSRSMNKIVPVVVVRPDTVTGKIPAVYLLHGFGDSYCNGWINKAQGIVGYSDMYGCLLVMPDGGRDSWYFDSPVDSTYRYETFVSSELVNHIDSHYPVLADSAHRAITGNSMGGHGALFLALRHPDVFGVAGSMSGGVNLVPFADSFGISKRLGGYERYPQRWEDNSIVNLVGLCVGKTPRIIFDCGTEDFFFRENCSLHDKMMSLGIPHEFIVRPGSHNWTYWSIALQSQMLYFNRFFGGAMPIK